MEWSTVILLATSMVSLLILMAIIIFGTRKSSEFKELEKEIGSKAGKLDSESKALWKALKESEAEKEKILERLKNLETIVTSEAWDAIQSGEGAEEIRLHLQEETPEEPSDIDKASSMAKKVR